MNQVFADLLTRIKKSPNHISTSAYDTAWLAWLYPEARDWVVDAQRPDGSWGGEANYYHDRVICTLSAINALAATSTNGHDLKRIERGIKYLERALPHLSEDTHETVAFELLVPRLVCTGQALGLKLDRVETLIGPLMPVYYKKLAIIPKELIYSPKVVVAHSLEFLGFEELDQGAIPQLRTMNGSIHNSPSATAFVEIAAKNSTEGRAYLDILMENYNGTVPGFAPFELYEIIWTLYHISLSTDLNSLRPEIDPWIEFLKGIWAEKGVGFSTTFIPDPDDSALALRIFNLLEIYQDPSFLEMYETGDHFQCFPLERNISLDVHIHIIHALKDCMDFPRRDALLAKAFHVLERRLTTADYVVDKWHISPYYSTAHAIIALVGILDNVIDRQITWLLKTQQDNGSWTFYPDCPKAAIEETAHALLGLMAVYENKQNIPFEVIERGFRYLEQHYQSAEELPSLWIHKAANNPYYIVESVILSAMAKYKTLI